MFGSIGGARAHLFPHQVINTLEPWDGKYQKPNQGLAKNRIPPPIASVCGPGR